MKPFLSSHSLKARMHAFRDLTARPADGRATRARVLALVGRRLRRRILWRRMGAAALAVLVALMTGSVAWTAIGRWRDAAVVPRGKPPLESALVSIPRRASEKRPISPVPPAAMAAPATAQVSASGSALVPVRNDSDESGAYAIAHKAHFTRRAFREALAAWDDYLRRFPGGAFAPEAEYNRVLCLVHLGRWGAAARALQPFVDSGADRYRHEEAVLLLAWIRTQTAAR